MKLISGKMLAVFGRGRRRIITLTVIAGVRGSGIYVEAEPERTYICTCYGICDIEAKAAPGIKETVKTRHHESPRFVYALGANQLITKAPVINHTDAELIMLERMAWRQPPFVRSSTRRGNGGNGGY